MVSRYCPIKESRALWRNETGSRTEQGKCKMNLEHLVVPISNGAQKQKGRGVHVRGKQEPT